MTYILLATGLQFLQGVPHTLPGSWSELMTHTCLGRGLYFSAWCRVTADPRIQSESG